MTEERSLSQIERVVDTFVAPSTTFRDILRSTSWWLPFLLLALSTLAVSYTVERKVGWQQVVENQIHLNPAQESQLNALDPPARAARMQAAAAYYRYFSYGSPLIVLVIAALGALILWASFNFGLGARTTYSQMLCLWMFANLPRLVAALVTIITLCFGGSPEGFNLQQPVGTNLGYYMSDAPRWLQVLLSFFDVVGIWVLVLLILGGSIVAKVKKGQAAIVLIGWWLLILVVSVAATAAFS